MPDRTDLTAVRREAAPTLLDSLDRSRRVTLRPSLLTGRRQRPDLGSVTLDDRLVDVLADAGYLDTDAVADLRTEDLVEQAEDLTVRDLDVLADARIAASYEGLGLDADLVDQLSGLRIDVPQLLDVLPTCGGTPLRGTTADLFRHEVLEGRGRDLRLDPDRLVAAADLLWHRRADGRPRLPGDGPVRDHRPPQDGPVLDLVGHGDLGLRTFEASRAAMMMSRPPQVHEHLAAAQQALTVGDVDLAADLAATLERRDTDDADDADDRYRCRVLAPAVLAAASPDPDVAVAAARRALANGAQPGSWAATVCQRLVARTTTRHTLHLRRRAQPRRPGGVAAHRGTTDGAVAMVCGTYLHGTPHQDAAALAGASALLDVHRATGRALTGRGRHQVRHTLTRGGTGTVVDAGLRATALRGYRTARALCGPPSVPAIREPEHFRFDWLLDEARRITDELADIDQLSARLIDTLYTGLLEDLAAGRDLVDDLSDEIDRILDRLDHAIEQMRHTLAGAVPTLGRHAVTLGVHRAIVGHAFASQEDDGSRWWMAPIDAAREIGSRIFGSGDDATEALLEVDADLRAKVIEAGEEAREMVRARLVGPLEDENGDPILSIQERLQAAALPEPLTQRLADTFGEVGIDDVVEQLTVPLTEALDALDLGGLVDDHLGELVDGEVSDWAYDAVRAIVGDGLSASARGALIGAGLGMLLGPGGLVVGGLVGWTVGSIIGHILGDSGVLAIPIDDGPLEDLQDAVAAVGDRLEGHADRVIGLITDGATVDALLEIAEEVLGQLREIFPDEVAAALEDAVVGARAAVVGSLEPIAAALESSFLRETLELVDVTSLLDRLPAPGDELARGDHDPALGFASEVRAELARLEATRVSVLPGTLQQLTQVVSVTDLLATAGQAPAAIALQLQGLLDGDPLPIALDLDVLDRLVPGLHRVRVRDAHAHLALDLDQLPLTRPDGTALTTPGGRTLTQLDLVGATVERAAAAAGGVVDPALLPDPTGTLAGAVGGLHPALGRVPTGLPLTLTHDGRSTFRLQPTPEMADRYDDGQPTEPTLAGTTLEPDPEVPGWSRLTIREPRRTAALSHLAAADTVADPKKVGPLEFVSPAGTWRLELPAVARGFLQPLGDHLPPVRDVLLTLRLEGHHDADLAEQVAPGTLPPALLEPTDPRTLPGVQDLLDDPLAAVHDVLDGLAGQLGDLADLLALGLQLDELDLDGVTTVVASLLSGVSGIATLPLGLADLTGTIDDLLDGGSGQVSMLVDDADLDAAAIADATGTAQPGRVVAVALVPLLDALEDVLDLGDLPVLGGLGDALAELGWPDAPVAVTHTDPDGRSHTAAAVLDGSVAVIDGADLGEPPSPAGTWQLDLPDGLPDALGDLLVLLFVETG